MQIRPSSFGDDAVRRQHIIDALTTSAKRYRGLGHDVQNDDELALVLAEGQDTNAANLNETCVHPGSQQYSVSQPITTQGALLDGSMIEMAQNARSRSSMNHERLKLAHTSMDIFDAFASFAGWHSQRYSNKTETGGVTWKYRCASLVMLGLVQAAEQQNSSGECTDSANIHVCWLLKRDHV
jgi:hypothetical protein